MIYPALRLLVSQLSTYIESVLNEYNAVTLGNVAIQDGDVSGKLVVTLINIEEEKTLKNTGPYHKIRGDSVLYHNPPIHLNLFILLTATHSNYSTALQWISHAMTFFQSKNTFTAQNALDYRVYNGNSFMLYDDFKLILDIYSPSMQEVMNIWTSLGGKHLPSVMYKVRLVTVFRDVILNEGKIITQTQNNDSVEYEK